MGNDCINRRSDCINHVELKKDMITVISSSIPKRRRIRAENQRRLVLKRFKTLLKGLYKPYKGRFNGLFLWKFPENLRGKLT